MPRKPERRGTHLDSIAPETRLSAGKKAMQPCAANTSLQAAYDSTTFRRLGHQVIDQIADYLDRATKGEGMPVLPDCAPDALLARWPAGFPALGGQETLSGLLERVLADSNHLHHPHYIGHQVTTPLPAAALADMVAGLMNNGMAVYEMGMSATAMEHRIVEWMCGLLGFPPGADGILTHGGSVGNLTALLAARQAKAGFDVWGEGGHAGPALAVLTSDQAHYSVRRAVQIMGWGDGGVITIPSDAKHRLRASGLGSALRQAQYAGRTVIGIVASSGSTATGAFDPLEAIADFCAANDLWLHVDAAHGGSLALSSKHRHLLAGIERADSVIWDAHKMLLTPALITAVLFREASHSYQAFAQKAPYLFQDGQEQAPWWEVGVRTLECTKRMLSVKLYAALQIYGTDFFAEYIDSRLDLARRFAAHIQAAPDFELAIEPQCNIVCFRYCPPGQTDLDGLQARIRQKIIASGDFYLVQTRLPAGLYLRVALINPLTKDADLVQLIDTIRSIGEEDAPGRSRALGDGPRGVSGRT